MLTQMVRILLTTALLGGCALAQQSAPGKPTASKNCVANKARITIKLPRPKTSPKVVNSRAAQAKSAVIAALQRQRQAADSEATQMKTWRPAASVQRASAAPTTNKASAPTAGTTQRGPSPQIGSSKTMSAPINPSVAAKAPPSSMVLACATNPAMRIAAVSGQASPTTFSPDAQYNLYTITGCSFGDPNSANEVYIYGPGGFKQYLVNSQRPALFWSDNGITASLDPGLRGVNDVDNVTLVVHRADTNKEVQKQGFKFYAAREKVALLRLAQSNVTLGETHTVTGDPSSLVFRYDTPAPDIANYSLEVTRSDTDGQFEGNNVDYFDFSKLARGFTTDSFQATYWPVGQADCSDWDTSYLNQYAFGPPWNFAWDGNNIRVTWQESGCDANRLIGEKRMNRAQYALTVWLDGPRGVDPWTGNPQ